MDKMVFNLDEGSIKKIKFLFVDFKKMKEDIPPWCSLHKQLLMNLWQHHLSDKLKSNISKGNSGIGVLRKLAQHDKCPIVSQNNQSTLTL